MPVIASKRFLLQFCMKIRTPAKCHLAGKRLIIMKWMYLSRLFHWKLVHLPEMLLPSASIDLSICALNYRNWDDEQCPIQRYLLSTERPSLSKYWFKTNDRILLWRRLLFVHTTTTIDRWIKRVWNDDRSRDRQEFLAAMRMRWFALVRSWKICECLFGVIWQRKLMGN